MRLGKRLRWHYDGSIQREFNARSQRSVFFPTHFFSRAALNGRMSSIAHRCDVPKVALCLCNIHTHKRLVWIRNLQRTMNALPIFLLKLEQQPKKLMDGWTPIFSFFSPSLSLSSFYRILIPFLFFFFWYSLLFLC